MLGGKNSRRKPLDIVISKDRDNRLSDDRTVIELAVDQVDGAAGITYSILKGLPLGIQSGEGRQQRGMYIQDPVLELANEPR